MTAPTRLDPICDKALAGGVLSPAEGLELFRALDLPSLGLLADAVRHRLNPTSDGAPKVTYIIDRNVNPTNVCITDCGFCAFYRRPAASSSCRAAITPTSRPPTSPRCLATSRNTTHRSGSTA